MFRIFSYLLLLITLAFTASANEDELFKKTYAYDIIYGKNEAPIQVIEYFSLTCPHCSHFYAHIFPSLKKDYIDTGKVRWVKRNYALDKQSVKGTMLLECVDKNRQESYLKILLSKQSNWAYQKDFQLVLQNIASLGGMPIDQFTKCMENKKAEEEITQITHEAKEQLKITGTPSFFINREAVKVYSEGAFRELFDKILNKK